jgi:outer membrane protein TolC
VLRLDPKVLLDPADTDLEAWQLPPDMSDDAYADNALERPDVQAAREQADAAKQLLRARWWDLVAPELYAEWRVAGVGGNGDTAEADDGSAFSSAAGSAGRSIFGWQNVGTAIAQGANPLPPLASAAGSGGRAFYAYKNLFGSTQQEVEDLQRQERYGVGLNWNLSFVKADRIREQRATAKAAGLRAAKAEDAAVGEVRLAQNDIRTALQLIALADEEIVSIETTHRLSLARFTAGTALAFEVLDAQDALTEARLKRARYITEFNLAQARLLAASGALDEASTDSLANRSD